jgi:hypothetical protein
MIPTLNYLAHQAVAFTNKEKQGGLWLSLIYELLDVRGSRNEHLANPLNRDAKVFYWRPRAIPFTGEEEVHGEFLTLDYCSHYPQLILTDFDSLEDLEASLLGPAGLMNQFTTQQIAFKALQLQPFNIYYDSPDGMQIRFEKHAQKDFDTKYPNPKLFWH